MIFCEIDNELLDILHKLANGRKFVDLGAGECLFEHLYTQRFPDEGVVSVEMFPQEHLYIEKDKVVRFNAANMVFLEIDLPIFIRPCHSDQFIWASLRNMENMVSECIYISHPKNVERDIPEDYTAINIPGWRGKDGEEIFLIPLFGEPYERKETDWWMVKLDNWENPLKMKKILRNGECHFINSKGGGFPCKAADYAVPFEEYEKQSA